MANNPTSQCLNVVCDAPVRARQVKLVELSTIHELYRRKKDCEVFERSTGMF